MTTPHDTRERRCPRLGHEVVFEYCRTQGAETVCPRLLDCWFELFDVAETVRKHLGEEVLEQLQKPKDGQPKVASLMELIEQARQSADHTD
ncbi:MAG: hypothetical protein KAI66_06300 [Lentisphaeria bacterium]|nr:hypothetical protein [Lentisphaeria bacterium]